MSARYGAGRWLAATGQAGLSLAGRVYDRGRASALDDNDACGGPTVVESLLLLKVTEFELSLIFFFRRILDPSTDAIRSARGFGA